MVNRVLSLHMNKIFEWDDIPSLDGVGAEWAYIPKIPLGRRAFVRVNNEDIPRIFIAGNVLVKVVTVNNTFTGRLLDIGAGGLALRLPVSLETGKLLRMGFYLGPVMIISKAEVKYSNKTEEQDGQEQYTTGVEFIDLDSDSSGYINGLYASIHE